MSTQAANPSTETAPPRRRLRWWGVLLIALGVLIALFAAYRLALEYRLSRELAALRTDGYPTNLEEVNDWRGPPPTEEEDGSELYRRAFDRIVPIPDEDQDHHPTSGRRFRGPLEPEDRIPKRSLQAIADDLERNAEAIDLLHRAANLPRARLRETIPADPDLIFDSLPLQAFRSAANLLIAEAMLHGQRDDPAGTAAALRATWRLSDALRDEPFLIEYLVRIAIHGLTASEISHSLHHTRFTDEQLTMLIDLLADEDETALRRAMIAELAWGLHVVQGPAAWVALGLDGTALTLVTGLGRASGLVGLNELTYIGYMREVIDATGLDWPDRLDAVRAAEDAREQTPLPLSLMSEMLAFSYRPTLAEGRSLATFRSARAALAVERYRLAHDRLPETLDDLTPHLIDSMPLDPFTGDPLKYKRLDTGYTIYSVGEDRTDDGGRETNAAGERFEPGADIPFTVAR